MREVRWLWWAMWRWRCCLSCNCIVLFILFDDECPFRIVF
jgi:hypothetical protein